MYNPEPNHTAESTMGKVRTDSVERQVCVGYVRTLQRDSIGRGLSTANSDCEDNEDKQVYGCMGVKAHAPSPSINLLEVAHDTD